MKQVQDAWRLRSEIARQLGVEPPTSPEVGVAGSEVLVLGDGAEAADIGSSLLADGAVPILVGRLEEVDAALAARRFDLAILCLPATGMEHLRLASRMKAQHATRDIPVLLVADPAQRDLVLRGFEIGASDYALRPVDGNELRARARNQIRRRRYEERLRTDLDRSLELAVSDPLTGLRNRRFVQRHLEAALRSGDVAVMMIDVDRFKSINDGHGHAGGDLVLAKWPTVSGRNCARRTWWRATAGKSSWWCCGRPARGSAGPSPSASALPWRRRRYRPTAARRASR
jgi:two-component system cell cycle response regulator